jgi:hypothetical protein
LDAWIVSASPTGFWANHLLNNLEVPLEEPSTTIIQVFYFLSSETTPSFLINSSLSCLKTLEVTPDTLNNMIVLKHLPAAGSVGGKNAIIGSEDSNYYSPVLSPTPALRRQ